MVARTLKRAFYFVVATAGVGFAVAALLLLTQTVEKSDDFDRLQDIISLLTPRVGGIRVCPIWPKPGREANRVLVRGRREARAGMVLGPGITVRDPDDRVTPEMEAIQRDGQALDF